MTDEPQEPIQEIPPPSEEQLEQAENLLRQAQLARIRGNDSVADRLLTEAAEIAPGAATVLEAIGDDFSRRRQMAKARDAYAKAIAADPKLVSAERKYAEAVLATSATIDPFMMAEMDSGTMASGKAAMIISIFLPGVGQMVTGQIAKGLIMLVGVFGGWAASIAMPKGVSEILKALGGRQADPSGLVFVTLGIAAACHLWSMFDASSQAKRFTPRKIERPVPPSDRPFDL